MPRTPHDTLADYLEAQSLLERLRAKRNRLRNDAEAAREDAGEREGEALGGAALRNLELGITRAEELLLEYERYFEECLHQIADEADRGRYLFEEVSRRMLEFRQVVGEHGRDLSPEELEQWERLLEDYRKLRLEWSGKIPPEECPPFPE